MASDPNPTTVLAPSKEVFELISWALAAAVQEFGSEEEDSDAWDWLSKVEEAINNAAG